MNRINKKLEAKKKLVSIYFTAGYPKLEDTKVILENLQNSGIDFVEIGLPYSDPLADGPVIQESSTVALKNGMTTELLFSQLKNIRKRIKMPLIIMGYLNPVLQYGFDFFCKSCQKIGIDGLIIPDLPPEVYKKKYKHIFEKYNLVNIFLITPQTPEKRIRYIDDLSNSFLYLVSSSSTTGSKKEFQNKQRAYFKYIDSLQLKNDRMVGFGIHDKQTFDLATEFHRGVIIGSAFIDWLKHNKVNTINEFKNTFLNLN